MPVGRQVLAGKPETAAGRRDKQLVFEQKVAPTGGQYPAPSWLPLVTVWASRLDLRADERYATAQEAAYKETQWHFDYIASMDPDLVDVPNERRAKYLGRIYNIRAASMIGRKEGIEVITLARSQ